VLNAFMGLRGVHVIQLASAVPHALARAPQPVFGLAMAALVLVESA
jgi:hypothetical protein